MGPSDCMVLLLHSACFFLSSTVSISTPLSRRNCKRSSSLMLASCGMAAAALTVASVAIAACDEYYR
eukprot:6197098-Pleurochrysis_carterae.AAC.1